MYQELPKDFIKSSNMGERGAWIEIKWEGRMAREDGVPKIFRGVDEGSTQFTSPLTFRIIRQTKATSKVSEDIK